MKPNFSEIELASFARDGFMIARGLADTALCETMKAVASRHLAKPFAPVEYEADVRYPGSPASRDAAGGNTVRRLLHAASRDPVFHRWATSPQVADTLTQLFGTGDLVLSQCHHNCIMTKEPGFSSATSWHQDNRYWSFDRQHLISAWLALGNENEDNGCLQVIPGTHRMEIAPGRFDAALFLRPDLAENRALMDRARSVRLGPGDVLFFHSRLFHAAGRNHTAQTKYSVVFTYHEADNHPIEGTRSSRIPGIPLS